MDNLFVRQCVSSTSGGAHLAVVRFWIFLSIRKREELQKWTKVMRTGEATINLAHPLPETSEGR